jgi:uncharacterized protein GlcG (DUF336 family)
MSTTAPATGHTVTLEEARTIISAATRKAQELGQPMNIAVVCAGGYLLAFERMQNAWLGSVDIEESLDQPCFRSFYERSGRKLAVG